MPYEVWDRKREKMIEISESDTLIAFKREYGKKVVVEPAKLSSVTNKHFVFVTDSGMDILINRNSDTEAVDCFYSNKNTWSISLRNYEDFEELF